MASYTLTGSGTQALSANVTALHVSVDTVPAGAGVGAAHPTNYYHVALLRFGDGTGFWLEYPVEGGPHWMGVPFGTTQLGYAVQPGGQITVTEVIGGTSPFGAPFPSIEQLSDVAISGVTDGQVLEWIASTSRWQNRTPSAGGLTQSFVGHNAVGASSEATVANRQYMKAITPAATGLLLSVGGYLAWGDAGGHTPDIAAVVLDDNAGVAGKMIAAARGPTIYANTTARWIDIPIGVQLAGSTQYWIGLIVSFAFGSIYYDSAGSDRTMNGGFFGTFDGDRYSQSNSGKNYSLRGLFAS